VAGRSLAMLALDKFKHCSVFLFKHLVLPPRRIDKAVYEIVGAFAKLADILQSKKGCRLYGQLAISLCILHIHTFILATDS
jgi:hypothetical protein